MSRAIADRARALREVVAAVEIVQAFAEWYAERPPEALAALPPLDVRPFHAELNGITGMVELLRLRLRREEAAA